MKWIGRLLMAGVLATAPLGRAEAQDGETRSRLLVSAGWLAEHLDDENLVLLHVGDEEEYAAAHLPGAHLISLSDVSRGYEHEAPLILELFEPEQLREALQAFGITNESRIVVYYGSDWVTPTTRVVFTLHYAGLGDQTSILDGGMQAWTAEDLPVTEVVPERARGHLNPLETVDLVVDVEWVQRHKDTDAYALIDGRAAMFYDGVREARSRRGHIPGAGSLPFTEVVTEELFFRSPSELRELFAHAGYEAGDTVIAYCHIGQQATAVVFAARMLGYRAVLYDGSMDDWGKRELPLENPNEGGH